MKKLIFITLGFALLLASCKNNEPAVETKSVTGKWSLARVAYNDTTTINGVETYNNSESIEEDVSITFNADGKYVYAVGERTHKGNYTVSSDFKTLTLSPEDTPKTPPFQKARKATNGLSGKCNILKLSVSEMELYQRETFSYPITPDGVSATAYVKYNFKFYLKK